MNSETLNKFKLRLEREQERLLAQIGRLEEGTLGESMPASLSELSVYDNHPADIGDELFERSKDIALLDNERILLSDVQDALIKIDHKNYGICEKCGRSISSERLEAIPWASQCLSCQQESEGQEIQAERPLEEASLDPAFRRTFLDESENDFVGFDGEDSLQAVLRYGSSDSPQDIPGSRDYRTLFPNHDEHQGMVELTDAIPASEEALPSSEADGDGERGLHNAGKRNKPAAPLS